MKRILNNFYVNFVALLCHAVAVALGVVATFNAGSILWGLITVLLAVGLWPMVGRLHRINRSMPKG